MKNIKVFSGREDSDTSNRGLLLGLVLLWVILSFALYFAYAGLGDWKTYEVTISRLLTGEALYGMPAYQYSPGLPAYYSNPPWLAVLLIPLGLVPSRFGWAMMGALGLIISMWLGHKFRFGFYKTILFVLSPATFYIIRYGQVDLFILAGLMLPREFWVLVAITKPQTVIGLAAGVIRSNWKKTFWVTVAVLAVSLIVFGSWPLDIIRQPKQFALGGHNIWLGFWPFQVPVGMLILLRGLEKKNDNYLLASSPFFLPYATMGNLIGLWFAVCASFKDWQVLIILLTWWSAIIFRAI